MFNQSFTIPKLQYLRALISCGDLHDAVRINLECHFDLWDTSRCGRNARKLKLAQKVVVLGERTLAFEDLNENRWLVIGSSRKAGTTMSDMTDSGAKM
jgi:hypothetical protein